MRRPASPNVLRSVTPTPYKLQVEAFARAIRAGGPPDPDADAGLAAVRLIEAASRSAAAGGAWVTPYAS